MEEANKFVEKTNGEGKKKREITTKDMIIPAKYFLETVANDEANRYPVTVVVKNRNGGSSWGIQDRKELLSLCNCEAVYQASLVYANRIRGRFNIDLRYEGRYTVKKEFMPERRHMETLVRSEARRFYDLAFRDKV